MHEKVVSRVEKESMWKDTDHDVVLNTVMCTVVCQERQRLFIHYLLVNYGELSGRRV